MRKVLCMLGPQWLEESVVQNAALECSAVLQFWSTILGPIGYNCMLNCGMSTVKTFTKNALYLRPHLIQYQCIGGFIVCYTSYPRKMLQIVPWIANANTVPTVYTVVLVVVHLFVMIENQVIDSFRVPMRQKHTISCSLTRPKTCQQLICFFSKFWNWNV